MVAVAGASITLAFVVVLSGLASAVVLAPGHPVASSPCPGAPGAGSGDGSQLGAAQLAAAEQSLAQGTGPNGPSNSVAATPSSSAPCGPSPTAGAASTTPSWTKLVNQVPSGSLGPSMVYDAQDHYVLLFGGINDAGQATNLTWTFANGKWTELHPAKAPPGLVAPGFAYDAVDHYVVMYGGYNQTSGVLSDTWKFVGGVWSKLKPKPNPGPIAAEAMAFDAKDGYVVLFGGYSATGASLGATWKFVGDVWTKLAPATHPSSRTGPALDWDGAADYLVLFGGYNDNGGSLVYYADTWTFAGGTWTKLKEATAPSARVPGVLAYDAIDQEVVLFGGNNQTAIFADTWTFANGTWTKNATLTHPPKSEPSGADGTPTTPIVVFGGDLNGFLYNGTWTFEKNRWTHVLSRVPAPRVGEMMAYDPHDGYVLLFGGASTTSNAYYSDTWAYSDGVWSAINPAVSPPARADGAMTYDAADGYMVLFGGLAPGAALGDTWTYASGVWTNLTTLNNQTAQNAPAPRFFPAMTYDYGDGYVVLFGGENATKDLRDTWTYSGGAWVKLTPSTAPSARLAAMVTYDSEDGYVLLFGGATSTSGGYLAHDDTWMFSGGGWTNLTSGTTASPPGTYAGALADDTYDGYPLMYGGIVSGNNVATTWEYNGTAWIKLAPATNPGDQASFGMAFDPFSRVVVLFSLEGSTWTY